MRYIELPILYNFLKIICTIKILYLFLSKINKMEIKIYKIKNSEGLFSTGTMHPRWIKKGKMWSSFGAVKSHLRQFCSNYGWKDNRTFYSWQNNIPHDWVVLEITNNETKEFIAKDLYLPTENIV